MKRTGNKNLKIIAATSMAIFTLMTTFSAAFAWFLSYRKEDSAANEFKIKTTKGSLQSITFHHLVSGGKEMTTEENGESYPSKYTFDKTPVGTINYNWSSDSQSMSFTTQGDTNITLDTYTTLDQEHPLLLMINYAYESKTEAGERTISAQSIVDHYLGERSNGNPVCNLSGSAYNSGQQDANAMIIKKETVQSTTKTFFPLSSAVKFMFAELADTASERSQSDPLDEGELSIDDISTENTYVFNLSKMESESQLKSGTNFVTVNDTTEESRFTKNTNIYSSPAGKHIKSIALVIDYYSDAIEFIYSTYLGNNTLEYDYSGILNFACDWTMVV